MSKSLSVLNPYTQEELKCIPMHGPEDLERILLAGSARCRNRKDWLPAYEMISILERMAELMLAEREELIKLAVSEGGKPWKDTEVEVDRAINGVKLGVHLMHTHHGEEIPMGLTPSSANKIAFTRSEPIGLVGSISAFNHPLNLIVHQVIPALAVGAAVIIKPALTTPLSCLKFVDLLYEAGLPRDFCQVLICEDSLAESMATDPRLNYLSFVGSAKVGWYLRSKVAAGTRVGLEHGGVAPVIITENANWEPIIPSLLRGAFYHAGQVCVSVQNVFVHASVLPEFQSALLSAVADVVIGDPMLKETEVGPFITPLAADKVEIWIKEAVEAGTKILYGGKRLDTMLIEPTVLLAPHAELKVSCEEIFGPVVNLIPYTKPHEVVERINALPYAFQAAVYSQDIDQAMGLAEAINASAVMINEHTAFRVDWMPFGGRDASGLGVQGIGYAMKDMSREKLVVIKTKKLN